MEAMTSDLKPFRSIELTVEATGLSEYFIRQGIREGWIPHIRCGCKVMINYPKFLAILDAMSETK